MKFSEAHSSLMEKYPSFGILFVKFTLEFRYVESHRYCAKSELMLPIQQIKSIHNRVIYFIYVKNVLDFYFRYVFFSVVLLL